MYQDSTSKHWYPQLLIVCVLNQEATRYLQEMILFTENPISSEAFYTSEQDVLIIQVCVFPNGTI